MRGYDRQTGVFYVASQGKLYTESIRKEGGGNIKQGIGWRRLTGCSVSQNNHSKKRIK